jgi:hypothetical protein
VIADPGPVYPWPIGAGARYHPTAANPAAASGQRIGRMQCTSGDRTFAVHLELFARRRVVIVPPGIGAGPKGCSYPVRTDEPTGVGHVRATGAFVLGDVFRVWGRRLGPNALLSFRGPVSVYVGGRRFHGDPRTVPLRRHAEIVVEIGGHVAPHTSYLFPKGTG